RDLPARQGAECGRAPTRRRAAGGVGGDDARPGGDDGDRPAASRADGELRGDRLAAGVRAAACGERGERIVNAKLLQLFGLKFHPFLPDIPIEGVYAVPQVESFSRRVEATVGDGGFVMV